MSFFKKLLNTRKEVKKFSTEDSLKIPERCLVCEQCNRIIYPYEKRKTIDGKKYHIRCFRKYRNKR